MQVTAEKNDLLTIAALGLLAMCIVTFDHEALGHASACILLHGHIRLLSSSLFRCDVRSGWIDPAGPAANLVVGTLAMLCLRFVPERLPSIKLLLIAITSFSYFWEAGYVIRAMVVRDGDLYFFAQFLLREVSVWERFVIAGAGLALYVITVRFASRQLLHLWPNLRMARAGARTIWISATAGAFLAAVVYGGPGWRDLHDSVLEIGGASLPLLFIPFRSRAVEGASSALVTQSKIMIVVAVVIYAVFVASLGRGIGTR